MSIVVAFFGVFVAVLGGAGIVSPKRLLDLVTRVQSTAGLYAIAALRLFLGAALLISAAGSRAPLYLQILGVLSIFSGLATPFFGVRRFEALLDWWRKWPEGFVRAWSLLVLLLGLSLVWAVLPPASGAL